MWRSKCTKKNCDFNEVNYISARISNRNNGIKKARCLSPRWKIRKGNKKEDMQNEPVNHSEGCKYTTLYLRSVLMFWEIFQFCVLST